MIINSSSDRVRPVLAELDQITSTDEADILISVFSVRLREQS